MSVSTITFQVACWTTRQIYSIIHFGPPTLHGSAWSTWKMLVYVGGFYFAPLEWLQHENVPLYQLRAPLPSLPLSTMFSVTKMKAICSIANPLNFFALPTWTCGSQCDFNMPCPLHETAPSTLTSHA